MCRIHILHVVGCIAAMGKLVLLGRVRSQISSDVWEEGSQDNGRRFEFDVGKLIVADSHDLVFGDHQSLDLPKATSPMQRNHLCSP